jgi:hypothetical protein
MGWDMMGNGFGIWIYDGGGACSIATPGFFLVAVSIFTAGWRMMGGLLHLVLARGAQALAYGVVVEDQDRNVYVGASWSLTLASRFTWTSLDLGWGSGSGLESAIYTGCLATMYSCCL